MVQPCISTIRGNIEIVHSGVEMKGQNEVGGARNLAHMEVDIKVWAF